MSIHKKFINRQLGGSDVISTQEIIDELLILADDERDALEAMLFREAAERLTLYRGDRERLIQAPMAALKAASGYLLNAKIDLETGAPKRTAIQTIEGGLAVVRAAIAESMPAREVAERGQ